jgi:twinkle protein
MYEGSKFAESGLPCPCGKSSDAYAIDHDGVGFCFRGDCKKIFPKEEVDLEQEGKFEYYPNNGLSLNTLKFYKVLTKFIDSKPAATGYEYPNGAIKLRRIGATKGNRFTSVGPMTEATLFGKDKFDPGSRQSITITEGEKDALSIYQVTGGTTAAVSVRNAATAVGDCKKEYDYINSFDKIIICLDNDDAGKSAAKEVASLFDFKKVYNVKLIKYKDANEYLDANDDKELFNAWRGASKYTPDNIISSFNDIEKSLEESKDDLITDYPFSQLNEMLWGLFKGEVIVVKGDEGIGKTEIFRAIEYHVLKTTNIPIGIIHLEEDNATTVKAIATYELRQPIIIPDSVVSKTDVMEAYKKAVKGSEDRVYIHSSFSVDDENDFLNNIRFLVTVCGCQLIFLDHISWLATGGVDEDERKKLDRISQKLKLLAKELRFCMVMISHVNDDGKTRGSRNISKVANTVINLSRNTVAADLNERSRMYLTVEKARLGGHTGPAGYLVFNRDTATLDDPVDTIPI